MKVISSLRAAEYVSDWHPESPDRLLSSLGFVKDKGFEIIEPREAHEQDVMLVHDIDLIESVKANDYFEPDTPNIENIYEYALLAAGAALEAQKLCSREFIFSLMRPPGHHARRGFLGGFCYFNNIAIAVYRALQKYKKIAVIDIDNHHGDGSQDIFINNPKILYVSLHEHPFFPGTGLRSEANCLNYPLPAGTEEKTYIKTLEEALIHVKKFEPDLIAISAGFDTHRDDPLGNMRLEVSSYQKIAELIKNLNKPTFAVLEGGYSTSLPQCIYSFLKGFS
ncbi:MAG: histone deacetylase [Candidatus Aenigmatarchaeota archaeon]